MATSNANSINFSLIKREIKRMFPWMYGITPKYPNGPEHFRCYHNNSWKYVDVRVDANQKSTVNIYMYREQI